MKPEDTSTKNEDGQAAAGSTGRIPEGWKKHLQHIRTGAKLRAHRAFPLKIFLFGLALLSAGVLIFALAPGNEPLTFLGFALVFGGLLIPAIVVARRVLRKIWLWIPAAGILFVIILPATLAAYITFFFPNEIVRQILEEEISKELLRPVSIGSLDVSIFSGIRVDSLVISDRASSEPFISASLTLSYDLFPLLIGQLRVHSAILESPAIHIRRFLHDGQAVMNIDDLLAGGVEEPEVVTPEEDSGLPVLPFFVSVGEVGLRNGSITLMDRATPGFANEYVLDQLECMAGNATWPIIQPLTIHFRFRVSMRQLDVEDGKTFNLAPDLRGKIVLRNVNGEIVPEGMIDCIARNGEFYGQQFLTMGQEFVEGLKRDFFDGIKDATIGNIDEFENNLKNATANIAGTATGKINDIVNNANKEFAALKESMEKSKLLATSDFDTRANKEQSDLGSDADTVVVNTRTTYNRLMKTNPAVASKFQIDTYINPVLEKVNAVREEYASKVLKQTDELNSKITTIIETEEKKHTDYINTLQGNLSGVVDKYAGSVSAQFRNQIGRAENFANSFDLDIPFLSKRMTFDNLSSHLSVTNGLMRIRDLNIQGKEFGVDAGGSYNIVNDDMDVRIKLSLDKRFASNAILSLFLNSAGIPELEFEISVQSGKFHFALLGEPIPKRMGNLAVAKAKEFIQSFINKNVSTDSFLASLRSDGGQGGANSAITAAKQSSLSLLATEKTHYKSILAGENKAVVKKIEEDILREAAAAGLSGIKNLF